MYATCNSLLMKGRGLHEDWWLKTCSLAAVMTMVDDHIVVVMLQEE